MYCQIFAPVAKHSALLIAWGYSALLIETNYFLDGTAGFAPAETGLRKPGKQPSGQLGSFAAQQSAGPASGKPGRLSGHSQLVGSLLARGLAKKQHSRTA